MERNAEELALLHERYSYPRFSRAEYQRRYNNIRNWMIADNLECLLVAGGSAAYGRAWGNIRYITNMMGKADQCAYVVFPIEGEPTVIMSGHAETDAMSARSVVGRLIGPVPDWISAVVDTIQGYGYNCGRIGIVEFDPTTSLPKNHWDLLTTRLPKCKFVVGTREFLKLRLIKSDEEVQCLQRSARLNDVGIRALAESLRPGMTEAEAFAIVYAAVVKQGGEIGMVQLASTSMDNPDLNDQRPRPLDRIISNRDLINNELGIMYNGYEAQSGKPIVTGSLTSEYVDMWSTIVEAYHRIVETLVPGKTSDDSIRAAECIRIAGYESFGAFVQGMYGYEPRYEPNIRFPSSLGNKGDEQLVYQEGMVFTVQPHLVSRDRRRGIFLADAYAITQDGPRCLNELPPDIIRLP